MNKADFAVRDDGFGPAPTDTADRDGGQSDDASIAVGETASVENPEDRSLSNAKNPLAAGLYVVATPIGNLADITLRALDILKRVDRIAAEDTRQTAHLLRHYGISKPMISLHGHNEAARLAELTEAIAAGSAVALVSDAGTPAIADPGAVAVAHLRGQNLPIFPIPGPSAIITAMSVAGLASPRFFFHGFLPHRRGDRRDCLAQWRGIDHPVVCYESPHRLVDALTDIADCLGRDRELILAKELTKLFEQVRKGTAAELLDWLTGSRRRGEFVLIILPSETTPDDDAELRGVLTLLLNHTRLKDAVKIAAELTGERKNRLYEMALTIEADRKAPTDRPF